MFERWINCLKRVPFIITTYKNRVAIIVPTHMETMVEIRLK